TIYVFGGWGNTPDGSDWLQTTIEKYRPGDPGWSYVNSRLPSSANGVAVLGPDGLIYIVGGYDYREVNGKPIAFLNQVQAFDPKHVTWQPEPGLTVARVPFAVVSGTDGRIYALGGLA